MRIHFLVKYTPKIELATSKHLFILELDANADIYRLILPSKKRAAALGQG